MHRFDALLAKARRLRSTGEMDASLLPLREGLGLWRGRALADVTVLGPRASEAARLAGLRVVGEEERIELELARGESLSLLPRLEALIASDPYRERLRPLLILARIGPAVRRRRSTRFAVPRKLLVDDLCLVPGNEFRRRSSPTTQRSSSDLPPRRLLGRAFAMGFARESRLRRRRLDAT